MKGCLGALLSLLLLTAGLGVAGWYQTNAAADAYRQGAKERVDATVVSAAYAYGPQNLISPAACEVRVLVGGQTFTVDADPGSGACDDNTPLRPHTEVSLEFWQGKVTAIYVGNASWPTTDNPGQANALPGAVAFFAVIFAVLVAVLLALDIAVGGLIEWLRRRGVLPAKRRQPKPAPATQSPPDMHVYPPE